LSGVPMATLTIPSTISNFFRANIVDDDTVRLEPPFIGGPIAPSRTYGGIVVSQALNALTTLCPHISPHTVNFKFVSPANSLVPIDFKVAHVEDGSVSSISAYQKEKLVGLGHVRHTNQPDFSSSTESIGHPDDYSSVAELAVKLGGGKMKMLNEMSKFPIEFRPVETMNYGGADRTSMWLRVKPEYRSDLQSADGLSIVVFLSDVGPLLAGAEIYERSRIKISSLSSLHHSLWVHEGDLDPFGWYLSVCESHVISLGRCRLESWIFDERRRCVATIVQEGYIQRAPEQTNINKL
ncbi:hypothetical protein PFISCL1PPCAC_13177, partial [Pristionchus fissidentatus]